MTKRRTRFGTWCKRDPEDSTKIFYTFLMYENDGKKVTKQFTSDDELPWKMLGRLRNAWIDFISKDEAGWHVVLYEE